MLESKAIVHFAFYIIVTAGCPRCPLHPEGQQGPPVDQPAAQVLLVGLLVYKPNGTSHQISKCRTKVVLNKKASPSWILAKNHSSDVLYTIRHSCQHQTERRTNSATLIKTECHTNSATLIKMSP